MFHRLVLPTYFGGLPVGYDYINDPVENGDAGVAAYADAKKSSGTNEGTYFVAFGEDATSSFANRGLKALAENTDVIDDLLHRDIALTARTLDVTAASPVSSIVLSGDVFVGENGVTNNQATRDLLVSVLDSSDNEIITSGGTKVQALLIHDGASTNVVGNQASGFYDTPTVNLNAAIPTGTVYRVYYGERGNLATLPKDAFTNIKIRGAQEVEAEVERTLRDLHGGTTPVWNGAWVATVNSLARTGLDGRYRLSTTDPGASPTLDTAGNGATITRDGIALTMSLPTYVLTTVPTVGVSAYPDPLLASFRIQRASPVTGTTYDTARGGDVGLLQETPFRNSSDANEVSASHVTGPLVLEVVPRSILASTLSGEPVLTRISTVGVAQVNPDAGSSATDRRTIQVAAGDFLTAGGRTALRTTDLIEVINNANSAVVGTFRVDTILSSSRFTVRALTGALPALGPASALASIRLRWLQPTVSIGGNHRAGSASAQGTPGFMVAQPGYLTGGPTLADWDPNAVNINALFLSAIGARGISRPALNHPVLLDALNWGGFDPETGQYLLNGTLHGDGGITTNYGRQALALVNTLFDSIGFAGNDDHTATLDLKDASCISISFSAMATTTTLNVEFDADFYSEVDGDGFDLFITIPGLAEGPFTVNWPVNFTFSGSDGVLPTDNPSPNSIVVRYSFKFVVSGWYAIRTDYVL